MLGLKMRKAEGERLEKSLLKDLADLEGGLSKMRALSELQAEKIKERLLERVASWNLTVPVDATRFEMEVAFLSDKAVIHEEVERLSIHIDEIKKLFKQKKSVGRKLDFLIQELHREINTIASKSSLSELSKLAVESKVSVEKLREQCQNVE
jgi:uncharacterized protein (TIGR00255 family)